MPDPDPFWWRDAPPTRPRRVEGGIQINSTRGPVARTWWSRRFLTVLESFGMGTRLARGRSYARAGQIVALDVGAGSVTAQVQGSRDRPYQVRIGVPTFGKVEWGSVSQALADDASYAATLLAGEMPREIEEVFSAVGLSLFPAELRDLAMDCNCPDFAVPCKHLAAVFYVLAERFDTDPFQILALRGRGRAELLADLRTRRAADPAAAAGAGAPLEEVMDRFWSAPRDPGRPVAGPETPADALLDQVPRFAIAVRGMEVTELLRPVYAAMAGADRQAGGSPGGDRPGWSAGVGGHGRDRTAGDGRG